MFFFFLVWYIVLKLVIFFQQDGRTVIARFFKSLELLFIPIYYTVMGHFSSLTNKTYV